MVPLPYAARTIVIDANLLLLLIIGTMDPQLIPRFKRTACFTQNDFSFLLSLVAQADSILTTPHVLTEVSNLANSLHDKQKDQFVEHFQAIIDTLEEHYTPAVTLAKHAAFRLGMADISMLHIADAALILTQDAGFASRVNRSGNGLALDLKAAAALRRDL